MLHQLVEVFINGITIGAAYAVAAIGLSLLYGVSRVFNYSYGSLLMLTAYLAWALFAKLAWANYIIVFLILLPVSFLMGLVIEGGIARPLRRKANWEITTILALLGLGVMINGLILLVFGPFGKSLPSLWEQNINIGGFVVDGSRLVILAVSVIIVIILEIFLKKSRQGMEMRAVSQDIVGAQIVGLSINRVFGYSSAISTVLAGISGILIGSIYLLCPEGGWLFFIKAFVVVAFGGIGSLRGALYAAFIMGVAESLVQWGIGPLWVMPFWLIILIVVLSVRPRGLLGIR